MAKSSADYMNWVERGALQGPPADSPIHDWWGDWYKRILQSQATTNAMPWVFDPLRGAGVPPGQESPATMQFGVKADPAFIRNQIFPPGGINQSGQSSGLSPDVMALLAQIPQDQLLLLLQNFIGSQGDRPGG